jgi:hypothetical protein
MSHQRGHARSEAGADRAAADFSSAVEREILQTIAGVRFGSVVITIQDGRVVQIDSTEKRRFSGN